LDCTSTCNLLSFVVVVVVVVVAVAEGIIGDCEDDDEDDVGRTFGDDIANESLLFGVYRIC